MDLAESRRLANGHCVGRVVTRRVSTTYGHRWLGVVMVALTFFSAAPLIGRANEPQLERIDAVLDLADTDIGLALKELRGIGNELESHTPYAVQRAYLRAKFELEFESGLMSAASETLKRLAERAQEQKDDIGIVLAAAGEASQMTSAGKSAAAITKLNALSKLVARMTDPDPLSYYFRVLSYAQLAVGNFEAALDSSHKALSYAEKLTRHEIHARLKAMNAMSNVYSAMNNSPKALEILDQAVALAKRHGHKGMLATLYLNQGGEYSVLGRTEDYMAANELALKMSRESGQKQTEAVVLSNIGDSWLLKKNYLKAESFSRLAMTKYLETGDQNGLTTAQANLGFALMGQGRIDEGAAIVRQALKVQSDANEIASVEGILIELGKMYEQAERYKEAVATIREQQVLSQQLFKAERERAVAKLQAQFDSVQRQKQLEYLEGENALKDAEIRNQQLQQAVAVLGSILALLAGGFIFALYRRTRVANIKLSEVNKQLEFHSARDVLTGLHNRRSFLDLMQTRPSNLSGLRREGDNPDGLLVLDIDHFKCINDTLGHGAGDAVLVEVARRLRLAVRESDMIVRWGGEEFLIFSPKASTTQISNLAQRILKVISQTPINAGGRAITVTVSGGFLCLPFSATPETECNWERALQIADLALYYAKVNGRNRVCGITSLLVPFAKASPTLENDLPAALAANMIEMFEAFGLDIGSLAPRLSPAQ